MKPKLLFSDIGRSTEFLKQLGDDYPGLQIGHIIETGATGKRQVQIHPVIPGP